MRWNAANVAFAARALDHGAFGETVIRARSPSSAERHTRAAPYDSPEITITNPDAY
jgi:hypothetical protein